MSGVFPHPRAPVVARTFSRGGKAGAGRRLSPAWAAVCLVGLALAGAARAEQQLPPVLQEVRIEQHLNWPVSGELEFRDESGRVVHLRDYFGKPTILVLAYYRCPKLCTLVLNGLRESLDSIGDFNVGREFHVVTVSFDPRETPELAAQKKAGYVAAYGREGAEEGWHFLTGDQASIQRLCQTVGFYYVYDAKLDQFAHPSTILFLTPDGRISRYLYGVQYVPRDVRLALVDASARKIGTPVDQALLYCFTYDPQKGKYTADVMRMVRWSGAATVLALAVCGAFAWRREWRRSREERKRPE